MRALIHAWSTCSNVPGPAVACGWIFTGLPRRGSTQPLELAILNLAIQQRRCDPDGGSIEIKVSQYTRAAIVEVGSY